MASSSVILKRYATALHGLASEAGIHEQVEAELVDLGALFSEHDDLRRQLSNPKLPRSVKKQLLEQILGDGTTALLRHTVLLMTDKGRAGLLAGLTEAYDQVSMAASGRQIGHVQSATPLDDGTRTRLKQNLEQLTGLSITLQESIDESLLGGLRVTIGSQMIDGSLKRRLEILRDNMLHAPIVAPS